MHPRGFERAITAAARDNDERSDSEAGRYEVELAVTIEVAESERGGISQHEIGFQEHTHRRCAGMHDDDVALGVRVDVASPVTHTVTFETQHWMLAHSMLYPRYRRPVHVQVTGTDTIRSCYALCDDGAGEMQRDMARR